MRWGPGIETNTYIQNNVGLWRGNQLVRLAWRPKAPSVALDFNSGPAAQAIVEPHRTLLIKRSRNVRLKYLKPYILNNIYYYYYLNNLYLEFLSSMTVVKLLKRRLTEIGQTCCFNLAGIQHVTAKIFREGSKDTT